MTTQDETVNLLVKEFPKYRWEFNIDDYLRTLIFCNKQLSGIKNPEEQTLMERLEPILECFQYDIEKYIKDHPQFEP